MLYGVGFNGNREDEDSPYYLFSVDNKDPNDTDSIWMYNLKITQAEEILAFHSSNSQENDFFFVTDSSILYLQAPGETFLRTYQLLDDSLDLNYAATRSSSGLFVAQTDFTVSKFEVAADNTSSGLSYRLDLYTSYEIVELRNDW